MDKLDCINIFLSEGAGINNIVADIEASGEQVRRDAFGHVRLDEINPGQWYANFFKRKLYCDKVLVQKSGYFARSSKPNKVDLELINQHAYLAVKCAIKGESGVIGIDEENDNLSCIDFSRIRGGKSFNIDLDWFVKLIEKIEA